MIDIGWTVENRTIPLVNKFAVSLSTNIFRKLRKYIDLVD